MRKATGTPVPASTSSDAIIKRHGVWSDEPINASKGSAVLTRMLPGATLVLTDHFALGQQVASVAHAIVAGLDLSPEPATVRAAGRGAVAGEALTVALACARAEDPLALAFSAGVNRAAACVVGQLAGPMDKRRIPEADVLARVSGIGLAAQLGNDLFAHHVDLDMAGADWIRYPGW